MSERDTRSRSSLDTALDILANKYRRRLLVALLEHNPQGGDNPQIPTDVTTGGDDLEALEIAMNHSHLPKLEAHGFIEWDRDSSAVRKGPRFDEVRPLVELMRNHVDELPDEWF